MVNLGALLEYYLEKGDWFRYCTSIEPYLSSYVPWSFPCYFGFLLTAYAVKQLLGPKFVVGARIQFLHNMFLVVQSAILVLLIQLTYFETSASITAAKTGKYQPDGSNDPYSFMGFVELITSSYRFESKWFDVSLAAFMFSKFYEQVDTVILVINEKPLIMLHLWHHATTYMAFYVGQFTGAAFWIGWWNSFIHVIMYLYYAKVPGMKHIAKYITSLQLFHLFGGTLTNAYTILYPYTIPSGVSGLASAYEASSPLKYSEFVDVRRYSIFNAFITWSYFSFFLAFYSRKYDKSGKGSVWSLIGFPKSVQRVMFKAQRLVISPGKVENYLVNQGIWVPEIAVSGGGAAAKKKA